jgi:putative methyltransferase (TIGR01177 family)
MIVTLWLSGENGTLARAEVAGAAAVLGGRVVDPPSGSESSGRAWVEMPGRDAARQLIRRLALARRCAEPWPEQPVEACEAPLRSAGRSGTPAAFQWVSGGTGNRPATTLRTLGDFYVAGGGRISLRDPLLRFWVEPASDGRVRIFEELGSVDRAEYAARQTPRLPFQRPVTMAPRLARAVVNLTRVGPGDLVVDPFAGTGALLLEAALVGARTVGIDASATMARGALQNFAHFGLVPETLRVDDAATAARGFPLGHFDALVTDPPYGRASGTRGERPAELWSRALGAWAHRVRVGGRLGIVVPQGAPLPPLDARLERVIPQRVHRSLTREFRVYLREPAPAQ